MYILPSPLRVYKNIIFRPYANYYSWVFLKAYAGHSLPSPAYGLYALLIIVNGPLIEYIVYYEITSEIFESEETDSDKIENVENDGKKSE